MQKNMVLAFDTANEVIALGLGRLDSAGKTVEVMASRQIEAHRASNTQLLTQIDSLMSQAGVERDSLACVCCGRGPGSFTGVRICMATAKGVASALEVPLVGVSSLDAVAWECWSAGARGRVLVAADAMRKEVYPVRFDCSNSGVVRLDVDSVVPAADYAQSRAADGKEQLQITGDALGKYEALFKECGTLLPRELWMPTGTGLLLALQAAWRADDCNPLDAVRHNPALLLPVYTRLSDAEENERIRLAQKTETPKNLTTGVQDDAASAVRYKPLDAAHAADVAALEQQLMKSDAWSTASVEDELGRPDRIWWLAFSCGASAAVCDGSRNKVRNAPASDTASDTDKVVAYAGGWVVDGQVQILKIACAPEYRRKGIARALLARVASDARDLGARECTLEVRAGNKGAQAFYDAAGLKNIGVRPRYYSDGEDAVIMTGPLPIDNADVAGMHLLIDGARDQAAANQASKNTPTTQSEHATTANKPLIMAIETSCDETAAALIEGTGTILADTVASQIDFHSRFGGVVPEIASRKHVEAICGVSQVCLETAAERLGRQNLRWQDLDAVAVTYAPGLVGALVVGVAFAKGAAWAADIPFIGVNHMEGHLYANKLAVNDIKTPLVVSLVSGGHTLLVLVRDWGDYKVLGSTVDDAVGEAFDKVAKALGLGYPGGPVISKLAANGNPKAIAFPRAMMHSGDYRFSLSGLKTAVITYINGERKAGCSLNLPDIAASFQAAVVDVQVSKAMRAVDEAGVREFCVGGGVAANPMLRAAYEDACAKRNVRLTMPPLSACGDNAAMIALVALDRYNQGRFFDLTCDAKAHVNLEERY